MNTDRRAILSLIAMGRITPAEAEHLLVAWNESRETTWILGFCLVVVCLAQLHPHEFLPGLMHLLNAQIPALVEAVQHVLSPIAEITGGLS